MKTIVKNMCIALTASTLVLTGCDTYMDVYSDYDTNANFTRYTTYAWMPDRDSTKTIYNNQVIRNNARSYVDDALADRDFRLEKSNPDVLVDLVVVNKHTETVYPTYSTYYYQPVYPYYPYYSVSVNPYYSTSYGSYYYSYPGYYTAPGYYPAPTMGYSTGYVTESDAEGSITLNMIDRKENKLVWTATAVGYLYDPDFDENNLSAAIDHIMDKYPVAVSEVNPSGQ